MPFIFSLSNYSLQEGLDWKAVDNIDYICLCNFTNFIFNVFVFCETFLRIFSGLLELLKKHDGNNTVSIR